MSFREVLVPVHHQSSSHEKVVCATFFLFINPVFVIVVTNTQSYTRLHIHTHTLTRTGNLLCYSLASLIRPIKNYLAPTQLVQTITDWVFSNAVPTYHYQYVILDQETV